MTTIGTAVLEIIPSLRGISDAIDKGTRDLKITPQLDMSSARASGQRAGSDINAGLRSANIGQGVSSSLGANLAQGAESAGRRMGSLIATGLKSTAIAGGALAATGIAAALHSGFSRLTAIDDAKFKLQALGNSTQAVQSIMDNALAAVKNTAFGLDEAATTAASAVAAGIQPGQQLTGYLTEVAGAAAVAGTSMADMGSIFNNVQTSGKAFTGDLNQLADRGLPIFQWLQDEYKVSGAALSKMVSDGKVDAATFQKVVAEHIGNAAVTMGGSIRGQLSNLKASFSRFGAELAGPVFAAVSPLTVAFTGAFDKVTTAIKPFTTQLTAIIGPWATDLGNKITAWLDNGGVQKIVEWFSRLRTTFEGLASGGGSGGLKTITDGVKDIGPVLAQAGPALSSFAEAMGDFGKAIIAVGPQTLTDFLVPALKVFGDTLKFVADNASWAVPLIGGLVLAFAGFKVVGDTVAPIFNALNGAFKIINTPIMLAQTAAIRAQAGAMTELSVALNANTLAATENELVNLGGAAEKGVGGVTTALAKIGPAAETAGATASSAFAAITAPAWLITLLAGGSVAAANAFNAWSDAHPQFQQHDPEGRPAGDPNSRAHGREAGNGPQGRPGARGAQAPDAPYVPTPSTSGSLASPDGPFGNGATYVPPTPGGYLIPGKKDLFGNGFATGGPVFGAGTATSDSIPALLSNNEHVWTSDEVNKLGGQAAMYRLRWMVKAGFLKGFDSGGSVAPVNPDLLAMLGGTYGQRDNWAENTLFGPQQRLLMHHGTVGVDPSGLRTPGGGIFNQGMNIDTSTTSVSPPPKYGYDEWRFTYDDFADATTYQKGERDNPTFYAKQAKLKNDPLWSWILEKGGGYAGGGAVGGVNVDTFKKFASGISGGRYVRGGPPGLSGTDCSGAQAALANFLTGGSGRFSTSGEGYALASRGFQIGDPPAGITAYWVGWKNGGPGGGHTAGTIIDPVGGNVNVEMGGSSGGGAFGGRAGGASGFANRAWIQLANALANAPVGAEDPTVPDDFSGGTSSGSSTGGGVSLPSSFSGLSSFALNGLGSGIGTTGSGSDLSKFGSAAGSAVSGQVSSALGVFGAGDSPPFLQAASQLLGGLKIGGHAGPGKSDGSLFDGSNLFGSGQSAAPLSTWSTGTGTLPPDDAGNMHGTRAGQAPGPQTVYNIRTATVEDAFLQSQRKENERNAAKLSVY